MKKRFVTAALITVGTLALNVQADTGQKLDAKAEFQEHCSSCHPDGGNIVNKSKSLTKEALKANGIKSWKDIVAKIRNPGPGMTKFDKKQMSDKEAKAVAEYILKTFK